MQQFKEKLKNVPIGAPQACSSTSLVLNRDQSLSVQGKVLTLNNLEVDLLQHKGGPSLRVPATAYVLNIRGRPLMPCSARKARILIKRGEAKVVKTNPFFVIQLNKATGEQVQACSLGVDPGSKKAGFSIITDQREIISGELAIDSKTSSRLKSRHLYRKYRRGKLWYRPQRYYNRAGNKKSQLRPSIQRKINIHTILIDRLKKLLPIDKTYMEVASFDIQRIENPDIRGLKYKQGPLYQYRNLRNYLLTREKGLCQLCNKAIKRGDKTHIHHIINKKQGGTDREKNLTLLHLKCHDKLHRKNLFTSLKNNETYKDVTFMDILANHFSKDFKFNTTFGYETSIKRISLNIEKTHYNDAFIIAGGTNQIRATPLFLGQKHRNNRILQKNINGFKPYIRRKHYPIQPKDIVFINGKRYVTMGTSGFGKDVQFRKESGIFKINIKKVQKVFHTGSIYLTTKKQ